MIFPKHLLIFIIGGSCILISTNSVNAEYISPELYNGLTCAELNEEEDERFFSHTDALLEHSSLLGDSRGRMSKIRKFNIDREMEHLNRKIEEHDAHGNAIREAKKRMNCSLPPSKNYSPPTSRKSTEELIFATGTFAEVRNRARIIQKNILDNRMHHGIEINVFDAAAERLWQNLHLQENIGVDSLSWICNIFGALKNPRYRNVLRETMNNAASSKLRKYAKKALNQIESNNRQGNTVQYRKGDYNISPAGY
jgi:hypothetical protein